MCHAAKRGNPARQNSSFFSEAPPVDTTKNPLDRFKDAADLSKRGGRWKSDFIWNTKWKEGLDFQEAEQEARRKAEAAGPPKPVGALGLSRVLDLNDMAQDLSEQLRKREPPPAPQPAPPRKAVRSGTLKATKAEQRKYERQATYNRAAGPKQKQVTSQAPPSDYDTIKATVQALTLGCVLTGTALASVFYSKEVAGSYAVGGIAGFTYMRMLQRSVDTVGGSASPQAIIGGALSNNRMLIPVLMTLAYNRWNAVAAPQVHYTAQLMPMLLGFFTYKLAIVGSYSVQLLGEMSGGPQPAPVQQQQQQRDAAEEREERPAGSYSTSQSA